MLCLVDPRNRDTSAHHVEFINAAWRLAKTPICGQRLIEQLDQQGTVYAGVANQYDRVVDMLIENEPKRVRGSGNYILQRLPRSGTGPDEGWRTMQRRVVDRFSRFPRSS